MHDHRVRDAGEPQVGPAQAAVAVGETRRPGGAGVGRAVYPARGARRGEQQAAGAAGGQHAAVALGARRARLEPGGAAVAAHVDPLDGVAREPLSHGEQREPVAAGRGQRGR